MSATVEVRIPTILRPYTKEEKLVTATGADLAAVIADLEAQYPGLADRLLENGALRRFINIYIGSLTAQLKSGDSITILPAVAGG